MQFYAKARKNMVDCQIHTSGVAHAKLLETFETVPREKFVPSSYQDVSYLGEDLILNDGRFLLEPATHARMVEALELNEDSYVLDLSVSGGYSAAVLSPLVTTVVAIDPKKPHLDQAQNVWDEIEATNICGFKGRLDKGWAEDGPYSHIFVSGAVSEMPEDLIAQLQPGGKMILVLKEKGQQFGQVRLVRRGLSQDNNDQPEGEIEYSSVSLFESACPYLPGFEPEDRFSF
ncbi:MAG: protein-L-isoaspartate O-methyltransferase [Pseudomonadota bacterium]